MKILLFGSNGQLGQALKARLTLSHDIIGLTRDMGNDSPGDLCGNFDFPDEIVRTIEKVSPEIIINAAAYTDVDGAETHLQQAMQINAFVPECIALTARKLQALFIHYSTDYVFDGKTNIPYKETSHPHPVNNYGLSKHKGEEMIRSASCQYIILRTSGVFSGKGRNFLNNVLQQAQTKESFDVVDDQFGSPTHTHLIADCTAKMIEQIYDNRAPRHLGLYHLVASNYASRFDVANHIVTMARKYQMPLCLLPDGLIPIKTDFTAPIACRPLFSALDNNKFQTAFGINLPDWKSGIEDAVKEIAQISQSLTPNT